MPSAALGEVSQGGQSPLGALGGVSGHLGGSQGGWGGSQVSGMSLGGPRPPVLQGLGMWGTPLGSVLGCPRRVLGQGGPTLCHPVPRHARAVLVPSRSQEMLADAFPSHQPSFPQTHPFSPHQGSFLRHKHPSCTPGGTPGCHHALCPTQPPGGGISFLPSPTSMKGWGYGSMSPRLLWDP